MLRDLGQGKSFRVEHMKFIQRDREILAALLPGSQFVVYVREAFRGDEYKFSGYSTSS